MYWLYWEKVDGPVPRNVKLLVALFKKKVEPLTILTRTSITNYIDIVDADHLNIAQRVDYYRAKLLYVHGGIWLDIDTVMLGNIDDIYEALLNSDKEVCMSVSELPKNVCLQCLISKPKSKIFGHWYREMEEVIRRRKAIPYTYFAVILARLIERFGLVDTILPFPNDVVFRFGSAHYKKFYSEDKQFIVKTIKKIVADDKKIIILYGSAGMYRRHIAKECMLGRMICMAFDDSKQ